MQLVGKFVKAISVHLCLFDSIGQGCSTSAAFHECCGLQEYVRDLDTLV